MVEVSQNQMTRRWGFRIIENSDEGSAASSNQNLNPAQRIICEDFSSNSPQEVFQYVDALKKALNASYYKISKDGIVYGYQIFDVNTRQIIFEEGGWLDQGMVTDHLNKFKMNIQGEMKMSAIPKSKIMNFNSGLAPKVDSMQIRDGDTGEIREVKLGQSNVNVNIDKIRREASLDEAAEADDNKRLLGE